MRWMITAAILGVASASITTQQRPQWSSAVAPLANPSGANSLGPQLSVSNRGVLLSWIEQVEGRATLKFAERRASGWSSARTVASGTDWFVNWADVPSVVRLAGGTLAAHWLQKSGGGSEAYDLRLSYSKDDGITWAPSFTPHTDGTKTEHGFASLFQMPGDGGLGLVWLDGRDMKPGHGEHGSGAMSLRFAAYDRTWKQTVESAVDLKVCECCPTSVAVSTDGPVAAYRNRADADIRDIHVTRFTGGKWSDPTPVAREDWQFPACPVNGPSVSARGKSLAVAWFQAKDGQPKAFVAFSGDSGRTFGTPIRLDTAGTLGRVDVEMLPDGSAAAAYIDLTGNVAELRVRRVTPAGVLSAPMTITALANNRSSGYPRMAVSGDELVFAWVDRDNGSNVRTASARLAAETR